MRREPEQPVAALFIGRDSRLRQCARGPDEMSGGVVEIRGTLGS